MKAAIYRVIMGEAHGIGATLLRGALTVASWGYGVGLQVARVARRPVRLPCPVVSIGNLTWGGTGKTPLAAHLAAALAQRGLRVAILARGYGGDEPAVLRRLAPGVPVFVGADRVASGRRAIAEGAQCLLLDDGFQHGRLHRDLDLVLLDAQAPFGTGHLLPRGNLREPPSALRRADLVVLTKTDAPGADEAKAVEAIRAVHPSVSIVTACYRPVAVELWPSGERQPVTALVGARAGVVSGIADPAAFEALVERLGVRPVLTRRFMDHHPYRAGELAAVAAASRQAGASWLVTTLKDAVRFPAKSWNGREVQVAVLHVALTLSDEDQLLRRILSLRCR